MPRTVTPFLLSSRRSEVAHRPNAVEGPAFKQLALRTGRDGTPKKLVELLACYSVRLNSAVAIVIMIATETIRYARSPPIAAKPASFSRMALKPCTA